MSADAASIRYWEDVEVGETLPELDFPITVKTLALAVCGTRDLMPYHHDPEYSKSVGNRDMFLNTMWDQALFGRYVSDWSGPESDFRETTLQMLGQLCPGDVAKVQGRVTEKTEVDGDFRVKIEMGASNELGIAATSSATIAMPSRKGGAVQPVEKLEKPVVEPHPEMPDFAKAWMGEVSEPGWGAYPVSEVQIMYWCDMVEDANPLYVDGDYARKSRHGGVIAPPFSLITWSMQRGGHQGVDFDAPDAGCPDRKPWPPRGPATSGGMPMPPGMRETIAQGSTQQYGKPLRPGDRVYSTSETVNCSPKKNTRLGPGYFQLALNTYYNQNDEIVGTNLFSLLRYGSDE